MASRTWLAIALCCFIWFGYLRWFSPNPPVAPTKTAFEGQSQPPKNEVTGNGASEKPKENFSTTLTTTESIPKAESLSTVKNPLMEVVFSSLGGKVSEVKLLKYGTTISKDSEPIRPVSPALSPLNLATVFSDVNFSTLGQGSYSVETEGKKITFSRANVKVGQIKKVYTVSDNGYEIDAEYELLLTSEAMKTGQTSWGYMSIPVGMQKAEFDLNEPLKSWEVVLQQNESVKRQQVDKISDVDEVLQGNTAWVAFGNRYFTTAVINLSEINPDVVYTKGQDFVGAYLKFPLAFKTGQNSLKFKLRLYSGPKDYAELNKIPGLKSLIDYGMFSFFAYPLLEILRFFYGFVHNYGFAIILLTILVRALFYPLSAKSFKSMKQMQKLQPQIALLKEKYKDNAQKQQQEQMALFKAHKVNPMGGCFPMLVQLPVFIALYAVLGNSIELFHAPFFGWIKDLSTKDPFYIYPVLMGISMFAQQKMTPSAGMDPMQQKMMLFMPVIFSVMMISLPSGLTIYIFVSTILGVLQQLSLRDPSSKQTKLAVAGTSSSSSPK